MTNTVQVIISLSFAGWITQAKMTGLSFLETWINFKSVRLYLPWENDTRYAAGKLSRWKFFHTVFRIIDAKKEVSMNWEETAGKKNEKSSINKTNVCLYQYLYNVGDWDSSWKSVIDHVAALPALALNVQKDLSSGLWIQAGREGEEGPVRNRKQTKKKHVY